MNLKAKTLEQWEKILMPMEIKALHDHYCTKPEQILTPNEVLDIIVEWNNGISSGYHIRSIISRVYGVKLTIGGTAMNRAHKSQLRELLLHLTALKRELEDLHWEIGEDLSIDKTMIFATRPQNSTARSSI